MKIRSTLLFFITIIQQFYGRILLLVLIELCILTSSQAQWQIAVSNTTQTLNGVSYGGGQWVTVGGSGTIITSPDGVNWTTITSGTNQGLSDISYAQGQWVAVGNSGTVLTSPDGIVWVSRVSNTTQTLNGVSYGGGQWIAVGESGTILTSVDGINWTTITSGTNQGLSDISYAQGQWVVVGYSGTVLTSTNGISWTNSIHTLGVYSSLYGISYGNGKFIIVKDGHSWSYNSILTSNDGLNWILTTVPLYSFYLCQCDFPSLNDVIYEEGKWVCVGENGVVLTSSDGITWTSRNSPYFGPIPLYGVGYGNGKFVTVGGNGIIYYSLATALPVSLVAFQAQTDGSTVHLTWETSWEKGASHFLIERSADAKNFEPIGQVQAQGTTEQHHQYSFLDKGLSSWIWYYRLRQVDLDGTFSHSQIIAVRIGTDPLTELTLSPNPSSGPMGLEYKAGIRSVSIHSSTGVLIQEQRFDQAVERWSWESLGQPSGAYIVRVQTQDGTLRTLRWMKQ